MPIKLGPRTLDSLRRIVIPAAATEALGMREGSQFDATLEGQCVVLRKREASCVFCGKTGPLYVNGPMRLCETCMEKMLEMHERGPVEE